MTSQNEDIFIIKINLDEIKNIDDINLNFFEQTDEIVYMNKKEYSNFILENSGIPITKFNCSYNCSICQQPQKYSHRLFKLNECSHIHHSKCIKKWFRTQSNNFKSLHKCPLCRLSIETIVDLN